MMQCAKRTDATQLKMFEMGQVWERGHLTRALEFTWLIVDCCEELYHGVPHGLLHHPFM